MKDAVYRARCIDKVLSKHSTLEVMEGLADVALDLFQLGLRDRGESASREQVRRQIRELDRWKRKGLRKKQGKIRSRQVTEASEKEKVS